METQSIQQGGATAPPTTADELEKLAKAAVQMEEVLRAASAVFDAILSAGMFDAAPSEEHDARLHNAGCVLLDMLRSRVRQYEETLGTDLSISLRCMADDARKAVLQ